MTTRTVILVREIRLRFSGTSAFGERSAATTATTVTCRLFSPLLTACPPHYYSPLFLNTDRASRTTRHPIQFNMAAVYGDEPSTHSSACSSPAPARSPSAAASSAAPSVTPLSLVHSPARRLATRPPVTRSPATLPSTVATSSSVQQSADTTSASTSADSPVHKALQFIRWAKGDKRAGPYPLQDLEWHEVSMSHFQWMDFRDLSQIGEDDRLVPFPTTNPNSNPNPHPHIC